MVKGFDRRLRLPQLALNRRPLFLLLVALKVLKLLVVIVDHDLVFPDLNDSGLKYGLEGFGAGEDDFATGLAGPRTVVELARFCIRWEDYVAGGKNVDLLSVAAFGDIT